MRLDELNALIAAVCPVISINSDGVIVFDPAATATQQASAQSIMTANLSLLNGISITPFPNITGFQNDIKTAFGGIVGANALAVAYPLFMDTLQQSAWYDLSMLITDAQSKGVINPAQYAAFKTSATNNNIPITLH